MLALLGIAAALTLVPPRDTTLTVRGVLQLGPDSGGRGPIALISLPTPLHLAGRRLLSLVVAGRGERWKENDGRYVEVEGSVQLPADSAPAAAVTVLRMRAIDPPGAAHQTISLSMSQRAVATLAVVPNRIVWRHGDPALDEVQPLLLYRLLNHGETELTLHLSSNELVCFAVTPEGAADASWRYAWRSPHPNDTDVSLWVGGVLRAVVPLPRSAAPEPGRYRLDAMLCGGQFRIETEFVVE